MSQLMRRVSEINGQGGLWRRFKVGDRVKVISDTVEGLGEVISEGKTSQARVQVLLQFMGRLIRAQVPWEHLWHVEGQPVDQPKAPRRTRGRGRWIRGLQPAANLGRSG